MYTDEDLELAVKQDIFTRQAMDQFRDLVSAHRNMSLVDEESFRLVSGFNDIFVVIACILLLLSSAWLGKNLHPSAPGIMVAILSWGLAEFFILKQKLALPAIVLLGTFVGGTFFAWMQFFDRQEYAAYPAAMIAAFAAFIATGLHWYRFKVPITIATGTGAVIGVIMTGILWAYPQAIDWIFIPLFVAGSGAFIFAMYWDISDLERTSYRSDVAFWLHLVAAPMIIHPMFSVLGVFDQTDNLMSTVIILALYLLMTAISLIIDRRAFMVSSLIYVLYAISALLGSYGVVGYNFAITGVFISSLLLLLSGFWHKARQQLVSILPSNIQLRLPAFR